MTKLLSIVTISFNQHFYLRQCLDSVISQKSDQVEYIVMDPGSSDGSREIIQEYADQIDHIGFDPDAGPSDGLNKGFANATGSYLFFLNSDDFLLPGAIRRIESALMEASHPDILAANAWLVDADGRPKFIIRPIGLDPKSLLNGTGRMVQHGLLIRRATYQSTQGFNIANRSCWDLELLLDLLRLRPNLKKSEARFACFRIHDQSITGGGHGERHRQRFQGDLDRLAQNFDTDSYDLGVTGLQRWKIAILARLRHPFVAFVQVAERLFPGLLRRAWRKDHSDV